MSKDEREPGEGSRELRGLTEDARELPAEDDCFED